MEEIIMKLKSLTLVCLMTLMIALTVCLTASAQTPTKDDRDIVETAVSAGSFATLAKALEAAGLTETLKGNGPFTVFAPTDEAFAKLPPDKLDALMQDKDMLKRILLAHVVSGKVMAQDVTGMKTAKTLDGSSIPIKAAGQKVMIGNAGITQTDIAASNGIIHVIDAVILPGK
jgi:uncharacterized surface protein with fasciclin (FAS1) repeats